MKPKGKIDWKQLFLFTKEGRIKNLDLIYGFFLGVALLAVSFAIGNRLTLLFETLLDGQTRTVKNLADTLVPMLLCLAIVWGLFRLIPKKIVVLLACWIVLLLTAVFIVPCIVYRACAKAFTAFFDAFAFTDNLLFPGSRFSLLVHGSFSFHHFTPFILPYFTLSKWP